MNIRKAVRTDLISIVALLADDKLGSQRENFRDPLPNDYVNAMENILNDPQQELMVLVDEDKNVIGTFQLTFIQYLTYQGGIRAQIEAVRIDRDVRGQGLGKVMFEYAIQRAQDRKAHVLQLTTDKLRPEAKNFYEELGFKASHEGMKMHF